MAMTLQSSGVPREMIGQVMGHKDLSTTNTYLDSFGDAEIEKVTLKSLYNNKELKLWERKIWKFYREIDDD